MSNQSTPFDQVYRGIFRAIYEGRLLPGQRLSAPRLMQEFGVGRGTVREAVNRLLAAGVVAMARNHSATVRMFSREEMLDLLDVVGALLRLSCQRAALRMIQTGEIQGLNKNFSEIRDFLKEGDLARFAVARETYYRKILSATGNQEMIRLFPSIHVHLMRLQLREEPLVAQSAQISDYEALHKSLLLGDSVGAGDAAAMHVWRMADAIRALPDRFFGPSTDPLTLPSLSEFHEGEGAE